MLEPSSSEEEETEDINHFNETPAPPTSINAHNYLDTPVNPSLLTARHSVGLLSPPTWGFTSQSGFVNSAYYSTSPTPIPKNQSLNQNLLPLDAFSPNQKQSRSPSLISYGQSQISDLNSEAPIGCSAATVPVSSSNQQRGMSPSASFTSDKDKDDGERSSSATTTTTATTTTDKEEDDRKTRLQLYVFVIRCIAYPFNAKQPTDMVKRQLKVTKSQLSAIKDRFQSFLNGEMNIPADEAFVNAVSSFLEVFLKSDRIVRMVQSGACSYTDMREVFKNNVEKRVRCLPEIDGLSKETVLNSWLNKFDQIFKGDEDYKRSNPRGTQGQSSSNSTAASSSSSSSSSSSQSSSSEAILTKEQLCEMFQQILGIKRHEHQLLSSSLQLDNVDEQAAQVRRELDSRLHAAEEMSKHRRNFPKFVLKEMESIYTEELKSSVSLLMANLENVPVNRGPTDQSRYTLQKFKRYSKQQSAHNFHINKADVIDDLEPSLTKMDVVLSFNLEVLVMEVKGLRSLSANKIVYCTMELEGSGKLQTDQAEASKPCWDTQGDFTTNQPLPSVKIKLCMETQGLLSLDDKELGRVILNPTVTTLKNPEWCDMTPARNCPDKNLKIKVACKMDKPQNMKHSGYLYSMGKNMWKRWKRRYFVLVQVSQYTFAMCSYHEKKADPSDILQLEGFTVDFCLSNDFLETGYLDKYFFSVVKEGDQVVFASDEENDRTLWVQAIYRATGQSHRPIAPQQQQQQVAGSNNCLAGSRSVKDQDKTLKHSLEEMAQADPCKFNHSDLFRLLQSLTLEYRLNDVYTCLGWFNPGQIFVLDEYCARYGVRGCHRHLSYLSDLLHHSEQGLMIDPTLMHYSFAFCASHTHGNRPDGMGTVLHEERDRFLDMKERLRLLLEYQITNFRYCFPFGRPEGALKSTLSLLERVLMKDIVTPVALEEVRGVIRRCLENAALVNYTKITETMKLEDSMMTCDDADCKKKLESLMRLAEMCIEVLQQKEEYHAEAFAWFSDLMVEHSEIFWSLFAVDMDSILEMQHPDSWDSFPLFQMLNDYLHSHESLCSGRFHNHLRDVFAPHVVRYVDLMESSIGQSVHRGFEKESWRPQGNGCATSEDLLWKLETLQSFIHDLHWPDEIFAEHLAHRLKLMSADMIEAAAKRTLKAFELWLKKGNKGTDYTVSNELLVMINVIVDFKNQHRYHANDEDYLEAIQNQVTKSFLEKLLGVLEGVLSKLARYDTTSLLSSLLSLTKPTDELGRSYVSFMRCAVEQVRQKILDELYLLNFFETWYLAQMNMIHDWLVQRQDHALHPYQLACLHNITRKCFVNFELQGVTDAEHNNKTYQAICTRLQVEEATHSVTQGDSNRGVLKFLNGPTKTS